MEQWSQKAPGLDMDSGKGRTLVLWRNGRAGFMVQNEIKGRDTLQLTAPLGGLAPLGSEQIPVFVAG